MARGGDAELNGYYLAATGAGSAPAGAPSGYVRSLFDDYADQFDEHLVQVLGYRAHIALTRHLGRLVQARFESALDLGCGTGLCGPLLKPATSRLTGVDLSDRMLEKERALAVYDRLVNADIVSHLVADQRHPRLIVAADVFIYVGDLEPVFSRGAPRDVCGRHLLLLGRNRPLANFELLPSLRYAHSESYLRGLAEAHGFNVLAAIREPLRNDQRDAIEGLCLLASRSRQSSAVQCRVITISEIFGRTIMVRSPDRLNRSTSSAGRLAAPHVSAAQGGECFQHRSRNRS